MTSTRPGPSVRVRVTELDGERRTRHEDRVVTEEPLEIRLAEPGVEVRRVSVTMRTPGHDFELAAGWLRHEGVVAEHDDLAQVAYCTDVALAPEQELNVVTATLRREARRDPGARYPGITAASSACGVCGTQSIEEVFAAVGPARAPRLDLDDQLLRRLPDAMREQQRLFDRTGGLHAAALFDADGRLLVLREDVGRHNAVDKVTGARLLADEPTTGRLLTVSGRIGFEIVQKAVAAGVGALVAVGAPTSLAVDLADRAGLPMLGWVRQGRAVVYTGSI
ncbi:formate dehydrogenase accessory sulfurtransferase FdhD [Nocardioides mangrovicus]|uniref:Sulfur carrier protein FdhD n=1 Tax=Nocardioides mangrovicus TaxID=2478913 RepID=A0A3L8NZN3_9ACTN|nr:formate dehydrogenase accessory sulfurtransferase FdhD [Nocardioides mangrovicus]RLV48660.1 formate dehydrogenase accessory sulfurtransferase FdhD [Nocardioides mangrovicus]